MNYKLTIQSIVSIAAVILVILATKVEQEIELALAGEQSLSVSEFQQRYEDYIFSSGVKDNILVRKSILNNMINEILLRHYDDNKNIFENPEYKIELEWSKKQAVLAYLKDQEVFAKIKVDDKELREAFVKVNEKISARHLFATTLEEAKDLVQLLEIGHTFEELAKQVFTDTTLANNGGYLGYFTWGDMEPEFENEAYKLKPGEISAPVKTKNGYSIIKVENCISNPMLTETEFLNKKSHLDRVLKLRKKSMAEKEYLRNIIDLSEINYLEKNIDNLFTYFRENELRDMESSILQIPNVNCSEYKDLAYSSRDIVERISNLPIYHKQKLTSPKQLKKIITGFILQDQLYRVAEEKNYNNAEPVLNAYKKMEKNLFLKYKRQSIIDQETIPDSILQAYYNENIDQFSSPRRLSIQEIIVGDKKLADSIFELIKSGSDFGKLAVDNSLRPASREYRGVIDLSPIARFGMFGEIFWNAQVGQTLAPQQFDNYFGIFKILNKMDVRPFKFNQVKDKVISNVKKVQGKGIFLKYIEKLSEGVKIDFDNNLLNSIKLSLN